MAQDADLEGRRRQQADRRRADAAQGQRLRLPHGHAPASPSRNTVEVTEADGGKRDHRGQEHRHRDRLAPDRDPGLQVRRQAHHRLDRRARLRRRAQAHGRDRRRLHRPRARHGLREARHARSPSSRRCPASCPATTRSIVQVVARKLKKLGVEVMTGHQGQVVGASKGGRAVVTVDVEAARTSRIDADKVLVAVGRRPNTEDLGLEEVGVKIERGFVPADKQPAHQRPRHLRDRRRRRAADARAQGDARRARSSPRSSPATRRRSTCARIPAVIFTDPGDRHGRPHRGRGEQARAARSRSASSRSPRSAAPSPTRDRRLREGRSPTPRPSEVLGIHIVGNGARDLITEAALAIEMGALADDLALTIHPHPTLSEAIMEAAKARARRSDPHSEPVTPRPRATLEAADRRAPRSRHARVRRGLGAAARAGRGAAARRDPRHAAARRAPARHHAGARARTQENVLGARRHAALRDRARRRRHLPRPRPAGRLPDLAARATTSATCTVYLRNLEEALIRALARFGIAGDAQAGLDRRVDRRRRAQARVDRHRRASAGSRCTASRSTSSTDLRRFAAINPCGLDAAVMGSMSGELGRTVDMPRGQARRARHLRRRLRAAGSTSAASPSARARAAVSIAAGVRGGAGGAGHEAAVTAVGSGRPNASGKPGVEASRRPARPPATRRCTRGRDVQQPAIAAGGDPAATRTGEPAAVTWHERRQRLPRARAVTRVEKADGRRGTRWANRVPPVAKLTIDSGSVATEISVGPTIGSPYALVSPSDRARSVIVVADGKPTPGGRRNTYDVSAAEERRRCCRRRTRRTAGRSSPSPRPPSRR